MSDRQLKMRLLMLLAGTILLGVFIYATAIQEVDYEARNYYNGDDDYDYNDAPTTLIDDDVIDDYVTAGARCLRCKN